MRVSTGTVRTVSPFQIAPDRSLIGQGAEDHQVTAAGRALADLGGNIRTNRIVPQLMTLGQTAQVVARSQQFLRQLRGRDVVVVSGDRDRTP